MAERLGNLASGLKVACSIPDRANDHNKFEPIKFEPKMFQLKKFEPIKFDPKHFELKKFRFSTSGISRIQSRGLRRELRFRGA